MIDTSPPGCDDNGYESSVDNDDDLSSDDDPEAHKVESDVSFGFLFNFMGFFKHKIFLFCMGKSLLQVVGM